MAPSRLPRHGTGPVVPLRSGGLQQRCGIHREEDRREACVEFENVVAAGHPGQHVHDEPVLLGDDDAGNVRRLEDRMKFAGGNSFRDDAL